MQAEIIDEDDRGIGVRVTDNDGIDHTVAVGFNGEIQGHSQDGYPDQAEKRTAEANEHVEQARKFAQYYVYAERGYDTVPPETHPERIEAVRQGLQTLSDADFEELFGDLHQQMASYHGKAERPIPVPDGAPGPDSVLYRQNVYLGVDPIESELAESATELAAAHDLDLGGDGIADRPVTELSTDEIADWQAFASDLADLARESEGDHAEALYVDAVSSLYATYIDDDGNQHVVAPDRDPFERDPDAMIELPPIDPGSLEEFRAYLDHHLKCQVRDSFVRMGLEPPEPFRVLGNGRLEATIAYKFVDYYPEYHDPENERLLEGVF